MGRSNKYTAFLAKSRSRNNFQPPVHTNDEGHWRLSPNRVEGRGRQHLSFFGRATGRGRHQGQATPKLHAPILINARLPADLFTWEVKGVPIDLKYRYTPPAEQSDASLRIEINDQFEVIVW